MGWMVWDLIRGLDVLLSRPGVDKDRVILLGSVAGGGDSAAVTAGLDARVKAVVPFNFGGPQPDFAVPGDSARDYYFFGVPEWESTRCLRLGARDGFAHWLIVGSVAPRRLIYAHEFAWDRDRDPVWPRLQKVFAWYDATDHLAAAERPWQPQRHAAGQLALQQHRPIAPQQDLPGAGALVWHAGAGGVQPAAESG